MNYKLIAKEILDSVGGNENIRSLTQCFTRLRFVLKDSEKIEKKKIEQLEGVISVVESGGQFQIVIGTKVKKIYEELVKIMDIDTVQEGIKEENGNIWNKILIAISTIFTPMIPAIAASGLLKGFLTMAKIISANKGVDAVLDFIYY